jgi:hypothetical protein
VILAERRKGEMQNGTTRKWMVDGWIGVGRVPLKKRVDQRSGLSPANYQK